MSWRQEHLKIHYAHFNSGGYNIKTSKWENRFLFFSIQFLWIFRSLRHLYDERTIIKIQIFINVVHFLYVIIFGEQTFSESLLFSRVALLNWFTKSSRFEGFNDNELLWSFSRSIQWVLLLSVFVQQERKFLLFNKELKTQLNTISWEQDLVLRLLQCPWLN